MKEIFYIGYRMEQVDPGGGHGGSVARSDAADRGQKKKKKKSDLDMDMDIRVEARLGRIREKLGLEFNGEKKRKRKNPFSSSSSFSFSDLNKDAWSCTMCPKTGQGREPLEKHLSMRHYQEQLFQLWGDRSLEEPCALCHRHILSSKDVFRMTNYCGLVVAGHLGVEHRMLEKLVGSGTIQEMFDEDDAVDSSSDRLTPPDQADMKTQEDFLEDKPHQFDENLAEAALESISKSKSSVSAEGKITCYLCQRVSLNAKCFRNHLAKVHFSDDLILESGSDSGVCGLCNHKPKGRSSSQISKELVCHVASTHGFLENLLPPEIVGLLRPGKKIKRLRKTPVRGRESDEEYGADDFTVRTIRLSNGKRLAWRCLKCEFDGNGQHKLMRHLAQYHFKGKILQLWGDDLYKPCPFCHEMVTKSKFCLSDRTDSKKKLAIVHHLGATHEQVLQVADAQVRRKLEKATEEHSKTFQSTPDTKPKCPLCQKSCRSLLNLKQHLVCAHFASEILSQSGSSEERCGECQFEAAPSSDEESRKRIVLCHIALAHGYLDKIMSDSEDMRDMLFKTEKATQDLKIKCPLCPKFVKTLQSFKQHLTCVHFAADIISQSGSTQDKCGICGYDAPFTAAQDKQRCVLNHISGSHGYLEKLVSQEIKEMLFRLRKRAGNNSISDPRAYNASHFSVKMTNPGKTERFTWKCSMCNVRDHGRIKLKNHLSNRHYREKLLEIWGDCNFNKPCPFCNKVVIQKEGQKECTKRQSIVKHIGATHDKIMQVVDADVRRKLEKLIGWTPKFSSRVATDERIDCPLCSKQVGSLQNLKQHLICVHFATEVLSASGSTYDRCSDCGYEATGTVSENKQRGVLCHVGLKHEYLLKVVSEDLKEKLLSLSTVKKTKKSVKKTKESTKVKRAIRNTEATSSPIRTTRSASKALKVNEHAFEQVPLEEEASDGEEVDNDVQDEGDDDPLSDGAAVTAWEMEEDEPEILYENDLDKEDTKFKIADMVME